MTSSRRQLLRGALAAGAAVPLLAGVRPAAAREETDAGIVESLIGLEHAAAYAYRTAARAGTAGRRHAATLRRFGEHEEQHARALLTVLDALGGSAPPLPRTLADVDRILPGLGAARTPADVLDFAIGLESAAVAAYRDAVAKLREPQIVPTVASIMASEGQHLVVLRAALDQEPVPRAFELGER